jgi:uncharacterized protein YidB (DUF937 family)
MSATQGLPDAVMTLINQHGGVSGLLQGLQSGGLQGVVSSWLGSGTNQQVTPDQLNNGLDSNAVQNTAAQHGMSTDELLQLAAQYLPQLIDHASPNGQAPSDSGFMGTVSGFLRNFQR